MATRGRKHKNDPLDSTKLERTFDTLSIRLEDNGAEPQEIVVCGGSALIATAMVRRTTADVDVVALASPHGLSSPDPLPEDLVRAVAETAEDLGLREDWLNNAPSRGTGGLFQMGLPEGIQERWHTRRYGSHLKVHFIGRLDQIHFKLYAAVDRGGYHIEDLLTLDPTSDELLIAARWAMTHDTSEGFRSIAQNLLRSVGHAETADRL